MDAKYFTKLREKRGYEIRKCLLDAVMALVVLIVSKRLGYNAPKKQAMEHPPF